MTHRFPTHRWVWCLVAAIALGATAARADEATTTTAPGKTMKTTAATTKMDAAPKTDPAQDAAMAEMMKYASPGPMHEHLKGMVGTWKAVVKMWMGPEPTVTQGTSVNTMILGGRYVAQDFKGTMMDQPFQGWGLTGYDNRKQQFTSFWVDNSSTAMMTQTGTMNEKNKELTFKGMGEGPDGKMMEYRSVIRIVDPNTHVFSMYAPKDGKDSLWMEITYTRDTMTGQR